jgi:hypothetical protein
VLDVIQAFAYRRERLLADRFLASQLVEVLPHFSDLIVGESVDEFVQFFPGGHADSSFCLPLA